MSITIHPFNEAQPREVCIHPTVGALLPDYIVDLLEESATEEVEAHLVACHFCKEKYLAILRMRYAARGAKSSRRDDDEPVENNPGVLVLADFKSSKP